MCRKAFSSQPVHSLALDNAIVKIVDKLGAESKAAREALVAARTKASHLPTSSTEKATASTTVAIAASPSHRRRRSLRTRGTRDAPITIEADEVGVIHLGGEEDEDDEEDESSGESDSENDYEEGFAGAYYGGYGRCYNCGRHW